MDTVITQREHSGIPLCFARFSSSSFLFFLNWASDGFGLTCPSLCLFGTRQSTHFPSPNTVTRPEVKTKPIHLALGDHIIVLYYLFVLAISHNSEKQKRAGIIGL